MEGSMVSSNDGEYLSCDWIEGGLAFNRRSLHSCLIVHHDTGLPFIAPFNGGPLPIGRVLEEREKIRQANRAGGNPACVGCRICASNVGQTPLLNFESLASRTIHTATSSVVSASCR